MCRPYCVLLPAHTRTSPLTSSAATTISSQTASPHYDAPLACHHPITAAAGLPFFYPLKIRIGVVGMTSQSAPSSPTPRAPSPLSFPPIEEKVEEEEQAAKETAHCPPSPLAHYYSSLTLSDRYAWPPFLGDWAFEDCQPRRVSTGCLGEEDGSSEVQRQVEESYAKDDLAVGRHALSQPLLLDHRHVTVRKRNSVCDIEFRFPLLPSLGDSDTESCPITRLQRPRDLPISLNSTGTPLASVLTTHSSIPEWEVVARRHSYVHISANEWVFLICLFVFVSLCLDISIHKFVLILCALQAMYYLLFTLV